MNPLTMIETTSGMMTWQLMIVVQVVVNNSMAMCDQVVETMVHHCKQQDTIQPVDDILDGGTEVLTAAALLLLSSVSRSRSKSQD